MIVTGRDGKACPCAPAMHPNVAASATAKDVSFMRFSPGIAENDDTGRDGGKSQQC
jgi:hypothetical protein